MRRHSCCIRRDTCFCACGIGMMTLSPSSWAPCSASLEQFHLKRVSYDRGGAAKLNDRFIFPVWLNMGKWVTPSPTAAEVSSTYVLKAIIMHIGSPTYGHYYAYVRGALPYGGTKSSWVMLDDDVVHSISEEEVLQDAFGGEEEGVGAHSCFGKYAKVCSVYSEFMVLTDGAQTKLLNI